MLQRLACLLLALLCLLGAACAEVPPGEPLPDVPEESAVYPPEEYAYGTRPFVRYESDTLVYTVERITPGNVYCYLTKIWVRDPERQIRKVVSRWRESLEDPMRLMKQLPEAVLGTNASGYVTAAYPDLPEGYPGVSSDYYFTTLGSVVVTDGEVVRNLEGVPFSGLALTEDGIVLYRGADNEDVLAANPSQTWAFSETCAIQVNGEDVLPEEGTWLMAKEKHPRTVIARVNRNNYILLHVATWKRSRGASLYWVRDFFSANFAAEWVYNLDGGSSSSLICRPGTKETRLRRYVQNGQGIMDILCFTE